MRCRNASAPGPSVWISPMWLTSKIPTRSRTALCSSRMPAYCTGISQPANGTSRAPAATWRSWRGVRFSVSVPEDIGVLTLAVGSGGAPWRPLAVAWRPDDELGGGDDARSVGCGGRGGAGVRGGCDVGGGGGDVRRRLVRRAWRRRDQPRVGGGTRLLSPSADRAGQLRLHRRVPGGAHVPSGALARVGRRAGGLGALGLLAADRSGRHQ